MTGVTPLSSAAGLSLSVVVDTVGIGGLCCCLKTCIGLRWLSFARRRCCCCCCCCSDGLAARKPSRLLVLLVAVLLSLCAAARADIGADMGDGDRVRRRAGDGLGDDAREPLGDDHADLERRAYSSFLSRSRTYAVGSKRRLPRSGVLLLAGDAVPGFGPLLPRTVDAGEDARDPGAGLCLLDDDDARVPGAGLGLRDDGTLLDLLSSPAS